LLHAITFKAVQNIESGLPRKQKINEIKGNVAHILNDNAIPQCTDSKKKYKCVL